MIFLPEVHVIKGVNLDSKTYKIKWALGNLASALGFGTQRLALNSLDLTLN